MLNILADAYKKCRVQNNHLPQLFHPAASWISWNLKQNCFSQRVPLSVQSELFTMLSSGFLHEQEWKRREWEPCRNSRYTAKTLDVFLYLFLLTFSIQKQQKSGSCVSKEHKFLYIIFILRKRSPLLGLGTKMRPFCSDQDDQAFLSSHRPVFFIMSKTKWTLSRYLPSSKPTWLEMDHEWRCISYWTHLIFHCHVSLLEGTNVCANKWKAAVNEGKIFSK